jgi:membrane glycosyltransferase
MTEAVYSLRLSGASRKWRLFVYLVLSCLLTGYGIYLMFDVLRSNDLTILEGLLLILFSLNFAWISFAFWNAILGFTLNLLKRDPITLKKQALLPPDTAPITTRTAVVMPVYNEDTKRITAGFEATLRDIVSTGEADLFDFFMLSDTTKAPIAQAELEAWQALLTRLGPQLAARCFYRRREKNVRRKVGNLDDFLTRWGSHYEHMIVLDADSVMTGACLLTLVRTMQANPEAGLVQTVPIPVRQDTFFGRFVQFAAVLYSPMLATGLAFWQTNTANYWGHNAIIRVKAFMQTCGLPTLPGKAPFGGDILSHDFVEAAFLRRGGWSTYLLPQLEGSYEEVPSNLLEYAKRDRRWVEGNIQHLALLDTKGLKLISRMHFAMGAFAYLSSPLWLIMLGLGSIDAVTRAITQNVFFGVGYQLFPNWPIAKPQTVHLMLIITAVLLLLPKLLAIIITMRDRRQQFGGAIRLVLGALLETLFAILVAPITMTFHAYFVLTVFLGQKVTWDAQAREGLLVPWGEAFKRTIFSSFSALIWGAVTFYFSPLFFYWLLPILIGLVLAAPAVRYSSSLEGGKRMRRWGLFLVPSEVNEVPALRLLEEVEAQILVDTQSHAGAPVPALPAEIHEEMPVQTIERHLRKQKVVQATLQH